VNKLKRSKLIEIRQQNEMTLQQVADEVRVSKPYYYMIESGKRGLSYDLAVKIASVFNKNPDDIFLPNELTKEEQYIADSS
jgi:putative transcriptional regulator